MGATSSPVILEKTPDFWMPLTHLEAIAALPQLRAVACCDISEASRIQQAKSSTSQRITRHMTRCCLPNA